LRVGEFADPARTEHQGFEFLAGKHQWRQQKSGAQHITDAGFAFDHGALRLQRGDVPVQSADADAQLLRQPAPAHRQAMAAQ